MDMAISQKIYKTRRHIPLMMGESKLIRILGTSEMPYQPTSLEKFADRFAERNNVVFNVRDNGLSRADMNYYFKKEASKSGLYLAYSIICHSDTGSRNQRQAVREFRRLMEIDEFEEQFNYRAGEEGIAVIRNPYYHEDGKYGVVKGSNALGKHSIEQVEELFKLLHTL